MKNTYVYAKTNGKGRVVIAMKQESVRLPVFLFTDMCMKEAKEFIGDIERAIANAKRECSTLSIKGMKKSKV